MKTTRHSLMAKGILVLLSLLVLLFAYSYSWFAPPDQPVTASGISASVERTDVDFDYCVGFKTSETHYNYTLSNWQSSSENTLDLTALPVGQTEYNVMADFNPKDVTGNGAKLFIPVLIVDSGATNGKRVIDTNASGYTEVTPNKEYISFDLIFKSDSVCSISLDEESFVKGLCESSPGDGNLLITDPTYNPTVSDPKRKSTYGAFSKDAVVGAIRVGFVDYTSDDLTTANNVEGLNPSNYVADTEEFLLSTPQALWLPRPDLYLKDVTNEVTGWSLITNIPEPAQATDETITFTSSGTQVTVPNTYVHQYYDLGIDGTKNVKNFSNTITAPTYENNSIVQVNIPGEDLDEDGEPDQYFGKVRVNIWVEGTDAESRRAISGGKFNIHFDLKAH